MLQDRVTRRLAELAEQGADLSEASALMESLKRGRALPHYARDHELRPPLGGYRSCIVGYMPDDTPILIGYRQSPRRILIVDADLHDQLYQRLTF